MDAVEKANAERQKQWYSPCLLALVRRPDRTTGPKTRKSVKALMPLSTEVRLWFILSSHTPLSHSTPIGREASTSKKVAIKKIKVGQFKDGLDMSAVREVKYLRELHHQNIIEVTPLFFVRSSIRCSPTPSSWTYSLRKQTSTSSSSSWIATSKSSSRIAPSSFYLQTSSRGWP